MYPKNTVTIEQKKIYKIYSTKQQLWLPEFYRNKYSNNWTKKNNGKKPGNILTKINL